MVMMEEKLLLDYRFSFIKDIQLLNFILDIF